VAAPKGCPLGKGARPEGRPSGLGNHMKHFVYILQSENKQHFYIGSSKDIEQRLIKHNAGSSKSTRPYRPWRIIYTETYASKELAMKREYFLKSTRGFLVKKMIIADNKR
jgi:putative endonuclease